LKSFFRFRFISIIIIVIIVFIHPFALRLVAQPGRTTTVAVRIPQTDIIRHQHQRYYIASPNGRPRPYTAQPLQQRPPIALNGKIRTDVSPDMRRRNHKCPYNGCKKVYTKSSHPNHHTPGEHANHYTTDAVEQLRHVICGFDGKYCVASENMSNIKLV
jgi:hypothetical protein